MDDMIKESLDGFESLWQRVSCREDRPAEPGPQTGTYSLEDTLLGLIHDETCAESCALALARMCRGDGRAVLQRHASQARRHLRRLRAEYFIVTGVAGGSNEDCRPLGHKLPALRTALLQAGDMAERYEKAAEQTDCPALREAFTAFSGDERRRAQELRSLVIGSF